MVFENLIKTAGKNSSFRARLTELERSAAVALGEVKTLRFAAAIYDPSTDSLHTFADNSGGTSSLKHYAAKISDVPSLTFARKIGGERVVDDLRQFITSGHAHTERLVEMGFRASYARSVHYGDRLIGLIFVNSPTPGYFSPSRVALIEPFVRFAGLHLALELSYYQTFSAAVISAQSISAYRDTDTAEHLIRMSHYSRIIADVISEKYGLNDDFVARMFQFAPMHDIGKVGVPDAILLKPGKLTPEEFDVMKSHVNVGLEMVDKIIAGIGLEKTPGIEILRNIIRFHHEKLDGTGYPYGLTGDQIPIEAQILAVADIFDALTSHRPYKRAWPIDLTMAELHKMAQIKINGDCVSALAQEMPKVRLIMDDFGDHPALGLT